MDSRAAKLALARKKLKEHQDKMQVTVQKDEGLITPPLNTPQMRPSMSSVIETDRLSDVSNANSNANNNNVIEPDGLKQNNIIQTVDNITTNVNVNEFLISNKRSLEIEISELKSKLSYLENSYTSALNNNNIHKQQVHQLENELENIRNKYRSTSDEIHTQLDLIKDLQSAKLALCDEKNNLLEQLDFTKTILTAKEGENSSLYSQLSNLQKQFDGIQLQMQQLTNGSPYYNNTNNNERYEKNEGLLQEISNLEQQLKMSQKERDQMNIQYEQYVGELNAQSRILLARNADLEKQIKNNFERENSFIQQISDMERKIQNYKVKDQILEDNNKELTNQRQLQENIAHDQFQKLTIEYENLKKAYLESEAKIKELTKSPEPGPGPDNLSMTKLVADIASDKIAAQRATEQNKKLKTDVQNLEEAFIKMSKDKLELTEKVTAEKYLNRELTIKLAEVDEKAKEMHIKLKAKDEEMIRLLSGNRDLERKFKQLMVKHNDTITNHDTVEINEQEIVWQSPTVDSLNCEEKVLTQDVTDMELKPMIETHTGSGIPMENAMVKLQERFLKIMSEVADLSDEKHRLEHIILQLQNETDTICEYVALYQQQRSLLKKRDEERSAQIIMFETECNRLKNQLEELSGIIIKFSKDQDLATYFQKETKHNDLIKVMHLLSKLRNSSLIDPEKKNLDFKDFYLCSCCSGNLINV